MNEEFRINPMIPLLINLADKRKRFVLFCGAGVSKEAGVPAGHDILFDILSKIYQQQQKREKYSKEEVVKWYHQKEGLKNMTYSELLSLIYPGMEQRRLYLNSFFEDKQPRASHLMIAKMVKLGLIRFIITTNFDNLIEKALDLEGLRDKYSVISTNDQAKNSDTWDKVEVCRIYKIHGDKDQGIIRNSPKELERLDEFIERDFQEIINRHGVIVLGYSGEDEGVMRCFERREYHRYPIYWIYKTEVNPRVKNMILNQDGVLIKYESASDFLNELLERIEMVWRSCETDTVDVIKNAYGQIIIRNNPLEIKAKIEKESEHYLKAVQFAYESVGQNPNWEDLWKIHVELIEKANRNIILAEQLLKFEISKGWEEFINFFERLYSINKSGDRYGPDGMINYLFYSLFLVIGSIALSFERFKELRKLFSVKRLFRDRMEYILEWNIIASYIEQKAKADSKKWYVPRFQYLIELIDIGKFPIKKDELREFVVDFDFLCFVYTVKKPVSRYFPYWYPCSVYYLDHRVPIFLQKIKLDDEYCEKIAKDLFNDTKDNLRRFIKSEAKASYVKLSNQMQGIEPQIYNPFNELFRDE